MVIARHDQCVYHIQTQCIQGILRACDRQTEVAVTGTTENSNRVHRETVRHLAVIPTH